MAKILITGGAGYVGNVLTPQFLAGGHQVVVFDTLWFGTDTLPRGNPNLSIVQGDLRDTATFARAVAGCDVVIHLACISNDPSFELDGGLSKSINYDCFEPMVVAAKRAGVKRFVYASTSSVYGVSEQPDVKEDHPLLPITDYNKYKGLCEPLLFKHRAPGFMCVTIRPATICGWSPRTRLDLSVNILTNHAITNRKITVFGGEQMRPNLHINDMCDLYELLLTIDPAKVDGETFNCGYQNMKIKDIALAVQKIVAEEFPEIGLVEIVTTPSNDIRSYHINSDKITRHTGWKPKRTIEDAVRDLCRAFKAGKLPDSMQNDWYYNVRQMKKLKAA